MEGAPAPSPTDELDAILEQMLADVRSSAPGADERVMAVLAPLFRSMAVRYLGADEQRSDCTPTDLVHEAYARLASKPDRMWQSRTHFYRTMLRTMRAISVDLHRRRDVIERRLPEIAQLADDPPTTRTAMVLALGVSLERLGRSHPRRAELVSLRVFGGLPLDDIATMLDISERTARREWASAMVWLREALRREAARV